MILPEIYPSPFLFAGNSLLFKLIHRSFFPDIDFRVWVNLLVDPRNLAERMHPGDKVYKATLLCIWTRHHFDAEGSCVGLRSEVPRLIACTVDVHRSHSRIRRRAFWRRIPHTIVSRRETLLFMRTEEHFSQYTGQDVQSPDISSEVCLGM